MGINSSVGLNGINRHDDVKTIQELLVKKGYKLRIDGICGQNTIKAIRKFQSHFMAAPDALVDKNGNTIRHLTTGTPGTKPEPGLPPIQNPQTVGDIGGPKYNPSVMKLSAKGIALLKDYEQFRAMPYDDQTGKKITAYCKGATVGYGFLIDSSVTFEKYKNGVTQTEALTLLSATLVDYESTVRSSIVVNLTQNEYDALVIFCYNIGKERRGFPGSTVVKIINGTVNDDLDASWKSWRKSQGKVNSGLINRRQTELNVYHKASYIRVN